MTDAGTTSTIGSGRRVAGAGAGTRTRVRWRIAERLLSVTIGGAAVCGAIWFGVTGPLVSPVTPPAAAGTTAAGTGTGTVPDDAGVRLAKGDRGGDGGGRGGPGGPGGGGRR